MTVLMAGAFWCAFGVAVGVAISWAAAHRYYRDEIYILQTREEMREYQMRKQQERAFEQSETIERLAATIKELEDDGR